MLNEARQVQQWKQIDSLVNEYAKVQGLCARAEVGHLDAASKLPAARASAMRRLMAYTAADGRAAFENCVDRSGLRDEWNQATIDVGVSAMTAEQARRLDPAYASSLPYGDHIQSRREMLDEAIEHAAMSSIESRLRGSIADGAKESANVARAEKDLFAYRQEVASWTGRAMAGPSPQPGDALADWILEVARTDAFYRLVSPAGQEGGEPFLVGDRRPADPEIDLCRTLLAHGRAMTAYMVVDSSRASLAQKAKDIRAKLESVELGAKASSSSELRSLFNPSSPGHYTRLDLASPADRATLGKASRQARALLAGLAASR